MIGLFVLHQQFDEPEEAGVPERSESGMVIELPKAHLIDPEFAAILEYGSQDSYDATWLNY
jgi:hypothetical protein